MRAATSDSFCWAERCKFGVVALDSDVDTTTAAGEMLMFQLMNFAQFERKQTSERVAANMLSRSTRGLYNGGSVPLGYKLDPEKRGTLVIDEVQAEIVRLAFNTYLRLGSISVAARWLNDQGYSMPVHKQGGGKDMRHGHFTVDNVHRILRNKAYVGIKAYTQKGEVHEVKAVWDGIVDEVLFNRVAEELTKNQYKQKPPRGKNPHPYLLSGVSFCMTCGQNMPA